MATKAVLSPTGETYFGPFLDNKVNEHTRYKVIIRDLKGLIDEQFQQKLL